jgi:hypothetical protein
MEEGSCTVEKPFLRWTAQSRVGDGDGAVGVLDGNPTMATRRARRRHVCGTKGRPKATEATRSDSRQPKATRSDSRLQGYSRRLEAIQGYPRLPEAT